MSLKEFFQKRLAREMGIREEEVTEKRCAEFVLRHCPLRHRSSPADRRFKHISREEFEALKRNNDAFAASLD